MFDCSPLLQHVVAVSPGKYHPFVGFNSSSKIYMYNHFYINIHSVSNLSGQNVLINQICSHW